MVWYHTTIPVFRGILRCLLLSNMKRSSLVQPRTISLVVFLTLLCGHALVLEPGVGLCSRDGSMQVMLFEHTDQHGSGGLVLNQPTPLRLRDLKIPLFHQAFADNSLMLGGGLSSVSETNVPLDAMAPWFWLHTVEGVPKSIALPGAKGPLFLGGDIERATELVRNGQASPTDFKFFYKYKQWAPGELVEEIACKDLWTDVGPMQPDQAVQIYSFPRVS